MVAGFKAVEGAGDFDFRGQGVEAAFLPRKLVASFVERVFALSRPRLFAPRPLSPNACRRLSREPRRLRYYNRIPVRSSGKPPCREPCPARFPRRRTDNFFLSFFLRTSKSDGKNVVLRHLRRFSGFYSDVKQAQNVLADNHKHQVANPDDVPAEQDAQNAGNDFTLADSGDCAANTRSRRNYRQNHADNVA